MLSVINITSVVYSMKKIVKFEGYNWCSNRSSFSFHWHFPLLLNLPMCCISYRPILVHSLPDRHRPLSRRYCLPLVAILQLLPRIIFLKNTSLPLSLFEKCVQTIFLFVIRALSLWFVSLPLTYHLPQARSAPHRLCVHIFNLYGRPCWKSRQVWGK